MVNSGHVQRNEGTPVPEPGKGVACGNPRIACRSGGNPPVFPVVPGLFHVEAGPGNDGHCRRRSESAVAFYGYFRRFHRGPVFIWMGFLKGAEKGHSSVDVRFFHS